MFEAEKLITIFSDVNIHLECMPTGMIPCMVIHTAKCIYTLKKPANF